MKNLVKYLFIIFFIATGFVLFNNSEAAFNGNSSGYAWSEKGGWISFNNTSLYGVETGDTYLDGYAFGEKVGFISLTRDTGTPAYGVLGTLTETTLKLSGDAWGPKTGYVRFAASGSDYSNNSALNYGVTVDGETGLFAGYAWSEKLGWISFAGNCSSGTTGICDSGTYGVITSWRGGSALVSDGTLDSATIDLGSASALLNSIMWQGTQPTGTNVRFHIASSNDSAGPWNFVGPDDTDTSYYTPGGPNNPIPIRQENHLYERYVRYRVFLTANPGNTQSPTVNDIIINYSS